jgi:hypothetical protein
MASSDKKGKGADVAKSSQAFKAAAPVKDEPKSTKSKAASPAAPAVKAPAPAAAADKNAQPKRKLGIKGAAPWAARHAAKHAAEARARAAEPAPPGSARATIRTPSGANELMEKLNELSRLVAQIKQYSKNLKKNFYEVGQLLREIQSKKLYEPKNLASFEALVEREFDSPKITKEEAIRLVRISQYFSKEGAMELGLEKVERAITAMEAPKDAVSEGKLAVAPPVRPSSSFRVVEPSGRAF